MATRSSGSRRSTYLHPLSGGVILGLDWLLFGTNVVTSYLGVLVAATLGSLVATVAVTVIQIRLERRSIGKSLIAGFIAGVLVAIPLPVAGTAVGGLVLAAAGLGWLGKPRLPGAGRPARLSKQPRRDS